MFGINIQISDDLISANVSGAEYMSSNLHYFCMCIQRMTCVQEQDLVYRIRDAVRNKEREFVYKSKFPKSIRDDFGNVNLHVKIRCLSRGKERGGDTLHKITVTVEYPDPTFYQR